jgi:hypothetical protein
VALSAAAAVASEAAAVARLSAVVAEALEGAAELWAPAVVRQSAQVAVLEVAAPA